ncbi:hypothetical protein BDP81DRAFT_449579 [Colletotrichum phormii]|uniref:Uncharacterized protein n=1 Tax=Colletotrichum phormii TaxID=359342 RepID=A0AAI9ZTW2_9PEZI|nr:uncharacterized protein BDP81DRAFT_449579 [Colletotrichum phormii]KAK1636572.1 hypothetical protein BDP81DRAFT_449579 [Colletotrichum phormii]
MANPQTPSTGAGANNNNLTPITKIRLLSSRKPITPPTTNTNTPSPQLKQTKLKLKASSSASADAASRRRKQHRGSDAGISPARQPKESKTAVQAAAAKPAAGTEATGIINTTGTGTSNWSPRQRIHHWLNQQVSIHLARLNPSSAFAVAARLGAAATKKPRILLNTQNIRWIQAKNGAWVETSLLTSKELALQKTKTSDDDDDVDMSE